MMYFMGNLTVQTADDLTSSRSRLRIRQTCFDSIVANLRESAEDMVKADETLKSCREDTLRCDGEGSWWIYFLLHFLISILGS